MAMMVEREQKLNCRNCATAFSFFQNTQEPVHVRSTNGAEKEGHNKFSLIDKIISMPSHWRRWRHGNLITENKIMCNNRHILMSYEFLVVVFAHSAFLPPFVCMENIGHKTLDRNFETILSHTFRCSHRCRLVGRNRTGLHVLECRQRRHMLFCCCWSCTFWRLFLSTRKCNIVETNPNCILRR